MSAIQGYFSNERERFYSDVGSVFLLRFCSSISSLNLFSVVITRKEVTQSALRLFRYGKSTC